ncbi:response regulator [Oryzomonas sagensis]|uniref:Response regulator n=1 Tax=Oryzomonas sagensis TaxID=2603857 RepID=A0ABQ6TNR4_9BACT|nr:response regulator [Oryzomonas sagensis]KAB0670302.1 response regulator [Oryzomonas sagensis]
MPEKTILIVDDEEMIRDVSAAMLEELGFATIAAANGPEAIRIFRDKGDVIAGVLLDMSMPIMDGIAVFRELRRIRPDVRVILASGYSEREVAESFGAVGVDGFVQKPFNLESLAAAVRRVVAPGDVTNA